MANGDLNNALVLEPLVESTMTFEQFLMELKGNEDRVGTAPVVILNAIRALGQEDPKEESNAERRRFLEVLQKIGIPSWKAFYHVCGSQLFANKLMKRYLEPAAAGGAQLKKMLKHMHHMVVVLECLTHTPGDMLVTTSTKTGVQASLQLKKK